MYQNKAQKMQYSAVDGAQVTVQEGKIPTEMLKRNEKD